MPIAKRSKLKQRSKLHVNKNNTECWGCHKKENFEQDCSISTFKEKASASIVEYVHHYDNEYVSTKSCNSGVYDKKCILESSCTLHIIFQKDWFSSY